MEMMLIFGTIADPTKIEINFYSSASIGNPLPSKVIKVPPFFPPVTGEIESNVI
jgi:hypothetical protein